VFLATSTDAFAQVPGTVSGAPDSGVLVSDTTAPAVNGGSPVTGAGCNAVAAFDTAADGCAPATGTISYSGTACAAAPNVPYYLTVPDWVSGPSDIAAVSTADRVAGSGTQADAPKLYEFAVPLDGSCAVTSVSLPDVGAAVSYQVSASGVSYDFPGLHILAMAFRNTTTQTPVLPAAASQVTSPCAAPCTSPAGQGWTGAFESPVESAWQSSGAGAWGNQTIRLGVSPDVSAPAGARVRIRLSDPGFLSADGSGPLTIGSATIAQDYYQAIPVQQPARLTFGGGASVTIPVGGDAYSDPLTLPFAVTAGSWLLVSLYLQNSSVPVLPGNSWASGGFEWIATNGSGDNTLDQSGTPFTGTGTLVGMTSLLTGVDVTTPATAGDPGEPTVVLTGDDVTDGFTSSALSDSLNAPSRRLAGQLVSQGLAAGYGVVDAGVESNQVATDSAGPGGVSLMARFDRDVLAEPDVGTVILNEGLEDLIYASASSVLTQTGTLNNIFTAIAGQLNQAVSDSPGIGVIVTTMTPCAGYVNGTVGDSCSGSTQDSALSCHQLSNSTGTSADNQRDRVNYDVCHGALGIAPPPSWADLDSAVTNQAAPEALASADDTGDHVNLTWAGYVALAQALVNNGNGALSPNTSPLPGT
jgi:hypothetical protein